MSVVVSDLDGTLLNSHHELSDKSMAAIHMVIDYGIPFIMATGRHYNDTVIFKEQINRPIPMITSNGANVHDAFGKAVITHYIPTETLGPIIALGKKYDPEIALNIYTDNTWIVEKTPNAQLLDFQRVSHFNPSIIPGLNINTVPDVQKIFFYSENIPLLNMLFEEINTQFSDQVCCSFSLLNICEVTIKHADKGHALDHYLSSENIEKNDIIVFADGLNDLGMLKFAHKRLIMKNADIRLLKSLDRYEQIGHCDDDAVADYLTKWLSLEHKKPMMHASKT